jgi:hypothetical protein
LKQRSLFIDACQTVRPVIWMLLCVPVLLALLTLDRFLPDYESVFAEYQENSLRQQRAQVQADALPRYREHMDAGKENYQNLSAKSYLSGDVEQSVSQFSSDVGRILNAVYIQPDSPIQTSVLNRLEETAIIEATVSFNCVPQQLQALELQLLSQSRLIKVTYVDVKVGPDALRGSQQLVVQLILQAVHLSQPAPQNNSKTAKPTS